MKDLMDFCTEQKAGPMGNESSLSAFFSFKEGEGEKALLLVLSIILAVHQSKS